MNASLGASDILCPMCLSRLPTETPARWRWEPSSRKYTEVTVPPDATPQQRVSALRGAMIRCPDPLKILDAHYLPADYIKYGRPVVLGFIGATSSGKTHLLSSMVGAVESGGLSDFGITSRPLDEAWHHRFMEAKVRPLLEEGKVLSPTEEKIISFADALLVGPDTGSLRPVALFDVAGGELSRGAASEQGAKRFLEIADGFIFVADSARLGQSVAGDNTFNTVLGLMQSADRLPEIGAAIVLNKADLRRFEHPVTRWLRSGLAGLDPGLTREESADIFAYLETFGQAWVRPYLDCGQGSLHVASATGGAGPKAGAGGRYLREVRPQRVLGPLISLLVMARVLPAGRARQVGA